MRTGEKGSKAGKIVGQASSPAPGSHSAVGDFLSSSVSRYLRVAEMQVGEYTGSGAAQDVALDFDPLFVAVFNLTDGTMCGWALNTANVGSASFRQSAALGLVKANTGVVFGAVGTQKFSLAGADAIVNIVGKVYQYLALGA